MYAFEGKGKTYYQNMAIDTALMAVNDCIAQGAMPVAYTDEVAAGDSGWFGDPKRSKDLADGFVAICKEVGMALPVGESPALRYLIKSEPPIKSAPSLSGCVTGIIAPTNRLITGKDLQVGDHIIGVTSSGLHANGVSLIIKKAMELPEQFLTKLPSGTTLGEEALIPTRSYVALIEALLDAEIEIHALLPGTGDGVGKIAFDKRPFTYRVHSWVKVPELFQFYREKIGISLMDCLKTFNWGIGYYIFASGDETDRILKIGEKTGYELLDLGMVEQGERKVIFEPENIVLPPPGQ
jgi:phosphoribosylformylglycinamidine cyclo-ligase